MLVCLKFYAMDKQNYVVPFICQYNARQTISCGMFETRHEGQLPCIESLPHLVTATAHSGKSRLLV